MSAVAEVSEALYALTPKTHAHRLAKWMMGRWVSGLRAAHELHICEIHPRLPEITRADGAYKCRYVGTGADKWAEYTLTRLPRIRGWDEAARAAKQSMIQVPPDDVAPWVPPPRADL